jgi:hypothetical protein
MQTLLYSTHYDAGEEHPYIGLPDFGDVQDNETALHIALYELESGNKRWGCTVLQRLRDHICTTREVKSVQWVLPQVEVALRCWCFDNRTPAPC